MDTPDTFRQIFPKGFVKKLKQSITNIDDSPCNTREISEALYAAVMTFTYHPKPCVDYITIDKQNSITRFIPSFSREDLFLYYACVRILEDEIAHNRVPGTYGGWRMGSKIRFLEEEDYLTLPDYAPHNSFNPALWRENWQGFQKVAYEVSRLEEYSYIVKLDIANFYDSINLDLLEKKIYIEIDQKKRRWVEILFYFLRNWNKKMEGYAQKTQGLPQEEVGDCSRLLANFYLQNYDLEMKKVCDFHEAKYTRYADDQMIFCKDRESAREIMREASKELFKIGLNINASKVKEFTNLAEFDTYWAFEIFSKLAPGTDVNEKNEAIELFFEYKDGHKKMFKDGTSVLKMILSTPKNMVRLALLERIYEEILKLEFITSADHYTLGKIYDYLQEEDKDTLLNKIEHIAQKTQFNHTLYNILKFYKIKKINRPSDLIRQRIKLLRH